MRLNETLRSVIIFILLFLISCSVNVEKRTDPKSIIEFEIAKGWSVNPNSSGTRFYPDGPDKNKIEIQINTIDANQRVSLEKMRDSWLSHQLSSGNSLIDSLEWMNSEFRVLEYSHTSQGINGSIIWHHALMESRNVRVSTWLMAPKDIYESYKSQFVKIIKSIKKR
jgi:hypothetical protein